MSHTIRTATPSDIPIIRALAFNIWPKAYGQMISAAQMEFMLEWMYSHDSLLQQMERGDRFLLLLESDPIGYASYRLLETTRWKLEKLYVRTDHHGHGMGRDLLEVIMQSVQSQGGTHLELQVNRNNRAVGFYQKMGFQILRDEDFDIGNGFYMNDHIMGRSFQ